METQTQRPHLTDEDFFRLALPPAGLPEALPPHLIQCPPCGRALQEWKGAAAGLAEEDEAILARRSDAEWLAAEEATLIAVRKSGRPGTMRRKLPWALALAASLLLAVLFVTERQARDTEPYAFEEAAGLSAQDTADDALLRDVALLARGEDAGGAWNGLAPMPAMEDGAEDALGEDSL